jgi:hypothetical protein
MRRSFVQLPAIAAIILALGITTSAHAWPPRFLRPRDTVASAAYAPQVSKYVVVSPTPSGSVYGTIGHGSAPQDFAWREDRLATPVYPWGWFGTRTHPQSWTHTGYYGTYTDRKTLHQQ